MFKANEIKELFRRFEEAVAEYDGVECWSARELQLLLDYAQQCRFSNAIDKAKESCTNAGEKVSDHFADIGKMIPMPIQEQVQGTREQQTQIAL